MIRAIIYSIDGNFEESLKLNEEGLIISKEIRHAPMTNNLINNIGDAHLQMENYADAIPIFEEAYKVQKERGGVINIVMPLANLAFALAGTGDIAGTKRNMQHSLRAARESNYELALAISAAVYPHYLHILGETRRARQVLEALLRVPSGNFMLGDLERVQKIIDKHLSEDEIQEAVAAAGDLSYEGILKEIETLP